MKKFDFGQHVAKNIPLSAPPWPRQSRPRYDFAVAYPDPDSFPADDLQDALRRAIKEQGRDLVLYPHPQGDAGLRDLVVEKLEKQRGMKVDPEQVIITAGSGQAISLLTQLFIDPGDTIITEEFTYSGALTIMNRSGAQRVGVKMDDEGMLPDALEEVIKDLLDKSIAPKFIYTIPTFQNPVGTDMGVQRRKEIVAVAQQYGLPIYEDDCYFDLRYGGENHPALFSYDDMEMTVYSGSFSKIVAPGMRLGWLVAPATLIPRINAIHAGTPPSQFSVLATLYYLRDHMEKHVADLNSIFKAKRDTMLAAMGECFGPSVESTRPDGGLYLWCNFTDPNVNVVPVLDKAREKGVIYGLGPSFAPNSSHTAENYFRLCFGYHSLEDTRSGIALLGNVFEEEGLLG